MSFNHGGNSPAVMSAFPAPSKSVSGTANGMSTAVTLINFSDKILITISQSGKLAHWVHVPLASAAADPMNPGFVRNASSENNLLPMTHLTATTILGGTQRDDETIGQTIATSIASAILMKRQHEDRLLVLGLGLINAAIIFKDRRHFDEIIGLVLELL